MLDQVRFPDTLQAAIVQCLFFIGSGLGPTYSWVYGPFESITGDWMHIFFSYWYQACPLNKGAITVHSALSAAIFLTI